MEAIKNIEPENIVVIDESGSDLSQDNDYGHAKGGDRIKIPKPHNPGAKFSIIAAISINCVLTAMYTEGAVNGNIFAAFIEKFLLNGRRDTQCDTFRFES